jgi:hypothetical protein
MSNILDQIKRNAVPVGVLRSAAKGALPLPPGEMLEILVYLTQNPVFAQDARMTLAGWDVLAAVEVVSDPAASPDVIAYYWTESNRRSALMPALIENTAVSENLLIETAATCRREMVSLMLSSPRARSSPAVIEALCANSVLTPEELKELQTPEEPAPPIAAPVTGDDDVAAALHAWHQAHADEIAAEEGKPFELVGKNEDEEYGTGGGGEVQTPPDTESPHVPSPAVDVSASLAVTALGTAPRLKPVVDPKNMSLLQRIAKMSPGERIRAAFTGGRDERLILIRDGAKIVQSSVLASPKLTEPEVESFASATNVSENVLREIARSRRFMKTYNVGRNLVNNPKCPLDLSLNLVKKLMVYDLKSLRQSKSIPETLRRVAAELYKEKTGPAKEVKRK